LVSSHSCHRFFLSSASEKGGGGRGSQGVLSDVGVNSCDDSTASDADAVLSGAKSAVLELASSGVVADCLGSGKASYHQEIWEIHI
jgi:hypothetical protein